MTNNFFNFSNLALPGRVESFSMFWKITDLNHYGRRVQCRHFLTVNLNSEVLHHNILSLVNLKTSLTKL